MQVYAKANLDILKMNKTFLIHGFVCFSLKNVLVAFCFQLSRACGFSILLCCSCFLLMDAMLGMFAWKTCRLKNCAGFAVLLRSHGMRSALVSQLSAFPCVAVSCLPVAARVVLRSALSIIILN